MAPGVGPAADLDQMAIVRDACAGLEGMQACLARYVEKDIHGANPCGKRETIGLVTRT